MKKRISIDPFAAGLMILGLLVLLTVIIRANVTPRCVEKGCRNAAKDGELYCDYHSFTHQSFAQSATPTTKTSGSTAFSKTCNKIGCDNPKAYGSVYCSTHTCKESGCWSFTDDPSGYCAKHKPVGSSGKSSSYNSSYKSSYKSSSSEKSSRKTLDDQDEEELYYDDPYEFEDIDDAWDYLEDEEDEWDD